MQHAENFKLLGVFLKTHGIEGHLILKLFYFTEEELQKGEPVFVETDGIPVPFFISEFRFLSDFTAMVKLDETGNSKQVAEFVNCRVYSERRHTGIPGKEDADEYDNLKGFRVVDVNYGEAGILQEIIKFPENHVMRLDNGGREILIPFHDDIVINIDHGSCLIKISAPEGLLEIYL